MAAEPSGWPNWRGPSGNGVAGPGNYPTTWSADQHVAWQTALPGRGASTPVISEQQLFVASSGASNLLQAFSLDGKSQWQIEVGKPRAGKHAKATAATRLRSPMANWSMPTSRVATWPVPHRWEDCVADQPAREVW